MNELIGLDVERLIALGVLNNSLASVNLFCNTYLIVLRINYSTCIALKYLNKS